MGIKSLQTKARAGAYNMYNIPSNLCNIGRTL